MISRALSALEAAQAPDGDIALARAKRAARRAVVGQILPERDYWLPILQALDERDGVAAAVDVIERVGELLKDRLNDTDREELRTGGTRWKKRTQFARFRMVEQGLLSRDTPRGVWAMTTAGRRYLERGGPA